MLVLPIDNTFLYVEPIYLQASQAKMPQLKKVALAMGNTLIYSDTYEQALAQLSGQNIAPPSNANESATTKAPSAAPAPTPSADPRVAEIRHHFDRYKELVGQGKWSDAGKELDAIQSLLR